MCAVGAPRVCAQLCPVHGIAAGVCAQLVSQTRDAVRCRGDGCARAVWHRNMCSVFSVPALARVQGVTDIARARPKEQRFQRQHRPEPDK